MSEKPTTDQLKEKLDAVLGEEKGKTMAQAFLDLVEASGNQNDAEMQKKLYAIQRVILNNNTEIKDAISELTKIAKELKVEFPTELDVTVKNQVEPVKEVSVKNLEEIKPHKEVEVAKPKWYEAIKENAIFEPIVRSVEQLKQADLKVDLDRYRDAKKPISVRLSDGNVHYTASGTISMMSGGGGGRTYTEGDVDASFTGPVMLAEGPSNTAKPLQVDASNLLQIDIASDSVGIGGGTQYTEDVATANPQVGNAIMVERDDQLSAVTPVEGDWIGLRGNEKGALWVSLADASGDPITSFGGGTEYTEDAVAPADPTGKALLMTRDDALSTVTEAEGDWSRARGTAEGALWTQDANSDAILADTANIDTNLGTVAGAVAGTEMQVDVVASLPAGTNAIGKLSANDGVDIGDVTINNAGGVEVVQDTAGDLNVTEANSSAIKTAVELIDNAIAGSEMQVDVVASLPAGTNAIGKVGHDITGIGHGVKTVTTAGTDEALAGSTACKEVLIQAQTDNTGQIAVGGSGVDATVATGSGVLLSAGDMIGFNIDDLADIYIDSTENGEGVRYTYWT